VSRNGPAGLAERATDAAAVVLLLALLASVALGVVSRAVNRPVPWTDEMAQHLLVWTGFVGWIIAARRRSHIRITVFIDRLPGAARLAAEVLIQLAVIVMALALLWHAPTLIRRNLDIEWVSLPISAALLYIPMPFAAIALIGHALGEMREAWLGRARAPETGAQPL
jgi:TRAP-type C4-dicarboxylate transport system permease small subunit